VALATAASATAGSANNARSTHAYVLADHALAEASERNVPKVKTLIARYKRKLVGECRKAAAGSPQNSQAYRLDYEVAGALWSLSFGADASAIHRFSRAVSGLDWSDPSIGKRVREYAKTLTGLASLPMPDVCVEVEAWRASNYKQVPEPTLHFDEHAEALEPYVLPVSVLKPYLQRSEASTVTSTEQLEEKLLNAETLVGGNAWYSLLEALDLNE
jgi:hypothetical protein